MSSKGIIVNFKMFRKKYSHYFYNLRLGNDIMGEKKRQEKVVMNLILKLL